ncbi:uncharacterized protein CEXT_728291 [Caerostris extrusa]|uniref:Uncharacterized protein n=1 Tax=Caerostris extrusa TaxID=172846 RepID=A0AAV4T5Z9_CAEEX|nr:uncharacterized protein CEXT_728291 [Caerostris extrusa]
MAVNKVTVAEVVGGVRGVIPSSKLATYGDYRYDLDLEEMYDILEEQNTVNYKSTSRHGDEENLNHPKVENKRLDVKSEETKDQLQKEKNCSRHSRLLKEPITALEILSIPKPYLEGSFKLDSKQEDDLWLKLSSPSIKKLWGKNSANELQETLISKDKTLGFDSWIGSTNFLRRQRQWKGSATTEEGGDIEISEERGKELIGSLLNYIDGSTDKMERFDCKETSNIENKSKNYFPEMHKDWNRISFTRRMDGVNEARANQTSNWNCYYNQQCEQQLLFKQVLSVPPPPPPPMMFPPPLCIPPPPLLTTMHSFPTQKLPFTYHQTTIAMQNATFQSLAHTSHHTVPGNKYYNQSQITPQFQMGSSTVLQINQKYEVQDHILIKPTQFYQSTLTNMDRVTTLQNEKLIKEIRKNKVLQNVTSQIPVTNKLPCLADSHQQNVGFQAVIERIARDKKATMMTESTHYKRSPLVIYNHQRSPITELRKEFSSALLPKSNMLYNPQQFPSKISKQNTFNNLEEIIKGDEKYLRLYTAKRSGHGIKKNELNICKPPEQGHLKRTSFLNFKDLQNILHQKRSKFLRYNDKNENENKAIYSSQRTGEKRCLNAQTKQRKLLNNKEKKKDSIQKKTEPVSDTITFI